MAPPKRKRPEARSTKANKRPKYAEASDDETVPRDEELWGAVCILEERVRQGKLQYRIKWRGIDPKTGRTYKPTWEPEENPNAALLAAWEQEKAARGIATASAVVGGCATQGPKPRPGRKSRIVESSPEASTSRPSTAPTQASTPRREGLTAPIGAPGATAASRALQVRIRKPGDFDPDEYERYSQLAAPHSPSRRLDTQGTDLDSSQLFATGAGAAHYHSSGVVQDSQSSEGEGSFISPTQQTTGTTQQSSSVSAHSPARSIPETIYDTTADSQSQGRREASLERTEVQDTFDSLESASPSVGASADKSQPLALASTNTKGTIARDQHPLSEADAGAALEEQDTQGGADRTTAFVRLPPPDSQDRQQATLTEHSERDEAAQFPFHSQHPLHDFQDQAQTTTSRSAREIVGIPVDRSKSPADVGTLARAHQQQVHPIATRANHPVRASFHSEHHQAQAGDSPLLSSTQASQAEDDELFSEFLEPEYIRSQSPAVVRPAQIVEQTVAQSTFESHSVAGEVRRHDFALGSQPLRSIDQSTASREQNAQVVHLDTNLSAQEDLSESIRISIEDQDAVFHSSPASRHDSSQETPEPRRKSADHSSSPIQQPPSHSLGIVDSQVPPRPTTPVPTSSLSRMASQDTEKLVAEKLKEAMAAAQAAKPYTSTRRMRTSAFSPAAAVSTPTASPNPVMSSRRLLRTGASDGTRSPSTVPDRSPAPPAPTSLRTIALTHASQPSTKETREETAEALHTDPPLEVAKDATPVVPAIVTTEPTVPAASSSDEMETSDGDAADDDDDTASLLNDDLELAVEEYVVPLFIEGRQSDLYSGYIKEKKQVLDKFLKDSDGVQPLEEVEEIISHFKAIETHIDLVFAEAGSAPDNVMNPQTQIEFTAQFGMENSVKFRFLHAMFHHLRYHEKHVVLVMDEDSDALFNVIEIFCKANFIHYNMPTRGVVVDPADYEGNLLVSIFPSSASPIIRPAHAIVCLDGSQEASRIRQKNWATNPDFEAVPILHLVIPRTVGHIERYLSSSLDKRKRLHSMLASLAQILDDLGRPIDEDTPRAREAGQIAADWLLAAPEDRGVLPLNSIGSVKDIIEYQTQGSQTSATSPAPERTKRPHDDEELDPAKRMRFTPQPQPQPQPVPSPSTSEHDITRISDSMPGTATDDPAALHTQIARLEEAFLKERALRESEKTRFAEQELMWDKQQTLHENQVKQYRLLLGKQQATEKQLETATKNNETLRERLAARTTELQALTARLDEQMSTHLLSDDEKLVLIAGLRKDLTTANEDKIRAQKAQESADNMLDYTKEEYRKASDAAGQSSQTISNLEAQIASLSHAASGQPAALKKLHLDRQYENMALQVRNLKAENTTLKRSLAMKEEELARAKLSSERMGVRTRGGSVTPQPGKTRSRAASPSGSRVTSLRNG